jgi:imidazole glycerol-phosphate synthase subunit HisH
VIALIDYGAGNLASVRKALAAIGASVWTPTVAGELGRAHGIVIPGVGHFNTTRAVCDNWRKAIQTMVDDGVPLLGICVGLQFLFDGSDEAPDAKGLSTFKGTCFPFTPRVNERLKVPHVGWNSLVMPRPSRLMAGIKDGTQVYFTHSYAAPVVDDTAAICDYGGPFSAAVERGPVSAVQFHPEKSGDAGLKVLSNWFAQVDKSVSRRSSAEDERA